MDDRAPTRHSQIITPLSRLSHSLPPLSLLSLPRLFTFVFYRLPLISGSMRRTMARKVHWRESEMNKRTQLVVCGERTANGRALVVKRHSSVYSSVYFAEHSSFSRGNMFSDDVKQEVQSRSLKAKHRPKSEAEFHFQLSSRAELCAFHVKCPCNRSAIFTQLSPLFSSARRCSLLDATLDSCGASGL